ncbi:uncharacterized protein LOC143191058 isoform X5 [Rhynchophorus ferrugineus]|uniref:uncharacterized protein LOC143191058 isoform X5 n=1 Tax=Rhynchophorus ferrugineus TaxID=354439 RepID=UPI003FCD58A5
MNWNYVWFILICLLYSILANDIPEKACLTREYPDIRTFNDLSDFKKNRISFNSKYSDFRGHNVVFKAKEIRNISANSFVAYTSENVVHLNLSHKSIDVIEPRAFASLICVKYLDLSHNNIIGITRQTFFDLASLTTLDLSWNKIRVLHHFTFKYSTNLILLDLSHNDMVRMEDLALNLLTKLERLVLAHNRYLRKFYYFHLFEQLVSLKYLDLSFCAINMFNVYVLRECKQLEVLDLAGNDIVHFTLTEGSVPYNNLAFMNLSDNSLMEMDVDNLKRLFPNDHLIVDINDNGFYCSELEKVVDRLGEYNISVSPGRSFDAEEQRNAIICDTVNATNNYSYKLDTTTTPKPTTSRSLAVMNTYYSEIARHRVIVILLGIILFFAGAYNIFIMVDYCMDLGVTKRVFRKHQPRAASQPVETPPEMEPLRS